MCVRTENRVRVCVCVRSCVRACVIACVRACMRACVFVGEIEMYEFVPFHFVPAMIIVIARMQLSKARPTFCVSKTEVSLFPMIQNILSVMILPFRNRTKHNLKSFSSGYLLNKTQGKN